MGVKRPDGAGERGAALPAAMGHIFEIARFRAGLDLSRNDAGDGHSVPAIRTGKKEGWQPGGRNVPAVHGTLHSMTVSQRFEERVKNNCAAHIFLSRRDKDVSA